MAILRRKEGGEAVLVGQRGKIYFHESKLKGETAAPKEKREGKSVRQERKVFEEGFLLKQGEVGGGGGSEGQKGEVPQDRGEKKRGGGEEEGGTENEVKLSDTGKAEREGAWSRN